MNRSGPHRGGGGLSRISEISAAWWPASALAALSVVVHGALVRHGDLTADEGWLVEGAERVLRGEVPHADFDTFYPAGHFLPAAAALAVSGGSLLAVRWMWVAVHALAVGLAWRVGRTASPAVGLAASLGLILVPGPPHKAWAEVVPLAVAAALTGGAPTTGRVVLAGAIAGVGAWLRQDVAVAAALAGCAALSSVDRRLAVRFLLSFIAAGAIGLVLLTPWVGPLKVLQQLVLQALSEGAPLTEGGQLGAGPLLGGLAATARVALAASAGWAAWRASTAPADLGVGGRYAAVWAALTTVTLLRGGWMVRALIGLPAFVIAVGFALPERRRVGVLVVPAAIAALCSGLEVAGALDPTYTGDLQRRTLQTPIEARGETLYGSPSAVRCLTALAQVAQRELAPTDTLLMVGVPAPVGLITDLHHRLPFLRLGAFEDRRRAVRRALRKGSLSAVIADADDGWTRSAALGDGPPGGRASAIEGCGVLYQPAPR